MEQEKLFNFTRKFFENLQCTLEWDNKVLTVRNVPPAFETAFRKKSPYLLVFDPHYLTEQHLLVAKDEEILNAMTNYLKKSGSTTLLKINFDIDAKQLISKNFIFRNSEISEIRKNYKNDFFYRFTFQTNFTYLNKKEQAINEIYTHNNKVVEGNLSGYPVEEGKKEDVLAQEIEKNYNLAKTKVKELIKEKTEEIGAKLNTRLETEIKRINEYFDRNKKETEEKIRIENERIKQYESEKNSENQEEIMIKIERAKKNILRIKEENDAEKFRKEQEVAINDEKQKSSLNIENNLINTTVIYYPIFTIDIQADHNLKKHLKIEYNPLTEELKQVECPKCSKNIKEIYFCSNGHVVCNNCIEKCSSCNSHFCKDCLKFKCDYCSAKLCRNCYFRCRNCRRIMCIKHKKTDAVTGEEGCIACLKACPECKQFTNPKFFKKDSKGHLVCQKCISKEVGKNITEGLPS